MSTATAYRTLVERYGCDKVADALLEKWLVDDDADGQWHMLMDAVLDAQPGTPRAMSKRRTTAWREVA
jgi:hypothetical protein